MKPRCSRPGARTLTPTRAWAGGAEGVAEAMEGGNGASIGLSIRPQVASPVPPRQGAPQRVPPPALFRLGDSLLRAEPAAQARQSYFKYLKRGSSGVPCSGPPSSLPGCHISTSSIFFASAKSFSVMPLASWFCSFTVTKAYETVRSG